MTSWELDIKHLLLACLSCICLDESFSCLDWNFTTLHLQNLGHICSVKTQYKRNTYSYILTHISSSLAELLSTCTLQPCSSSSPMRPHAENPKNTAHRKCVCDLHLSHGPTASWKLWSKQGSPWATHKKNKKPMGPCCHILATSARQTWSHQSPGQIILKHGAKTVLLSWLPPPVMPAAPVPAAISSGYTPCSMKPAASHHHAEIACMLPITIKSNIMNGCSASWRG